MVIISKEVKNNHTIDFSKVEESLEVTKEIILTYITDKDIFERFLGIQLNRNKLISCPYSTDTNPSFSLFKTALGKWRYNHISKGDVGDCFKFVQNLLGVDYPTALKVIMREFNVNNLRKQVGSYGPSISSPFKDTNTSIVRLDPAKQIVTTNTKINVELNAWRKQDIDYWNSYGITLGTLSRYRVVNLKKVWFNNNPTPLESGGPKLMYGYRFGTEYPDVRYKIYRPIEVTKTNKWFSNCRASDVMGLDQLRKGDSDKRLVITKSLKDVMALDVLGYNAVAPQSEMTPIPDTIMMDLLRRYSEITVLYDNDPAGQKGAAAMCDSWGLQAAYINDDIAKDVSDYIHMYGTTKTSEMLELLLNF